MATFNQDIALKFQVTKDGDVEETRFKQGDEVSIVQEWANYFLVKDDDGHFYNVPKNALEP